jgi:acetate kinase
VRILTVNAGSSSLKLSIVEGQRVHAAEELPGDPDDEAIARATADIGRADATAHRFVHGGRRFERPVAVDADVEAGLRELAPLAPLHQAAALRALGAARKALPDVPAIACFDTTFHVTLPPAAATYAVPREWRERWGIRRYGFHGLSHAYASRRAAELLGRNAADLRIVVCHLGAGASLCAVRAGRSVDTTMGFTPLDGLVMATRAGSIDPGAVLWLLEHAGLSAADLEHSLEHESGLLALGGSADMRELLVRADGGDPDATLALDVYLHSLRAGIASMTAALGGLDVLVFTGGVGEHTPAVRARAAESLAFLGIAIDAAANTNPREDADVSEAGTTVRTLVLHAREDLEMARQAEDMLT